MALLQFVPAHAADRIMISVTLLGFAAAIFWLRARVRGVEGLGLAALWSTLLGLNLTWLFGFYSFLLGASLFAITLGVWWKGREALTGMHSVFLGALLVLGYFCHPISLGWTVLGLIVLSVCEGRTGLVRRWTWTLMSFVPIVPLAIVYRQIMRGGGELQPVWGTLGNNPWSIRAWKEQLGWVDPLTLGRKVAAPFLDAESSVFVVITPVLWFSVAAAILTVASLVRRTPTTDRPRHQQIGWAVLAALLLVGGIVSPDTLGPRHGNYLAQRTVLLGLVALLPALRIEAGRASTRIAALALGLAVVFQTAFVIDYARRAGPVVTTFLSAKPSCGQKQRIGALLVELRGRYRVNPLLHLDSLLGVEAGNVVWGNYESAFYYFPVQIRPGVPHPPVLEFEEISRLDGPGDAGERVKRWERLLSEHHTEIDVVVTWGRDPVVDRVTARWFKRTFANGKVRVWHNRKDGDSGETGELDRLPPTG
jgi:hypothetical protein